MTMALYMFTLGLLVLVPKISLQQQCRSLSDLGQTECVLLSPAYNAYQWATCLTEDYIIRVSNGDHVCRSETATQCWYQCMLEIYGAEEGSVNSGCACTAGETLSNDITIPVECYSPRGDDCGWYENCLERRYPCRGTDDGYAIEYAQKFCNLYSDNYNDFSSVGRQWVDAVRQCLQVALVPSLRLWVSNTCADIRRQAIDSHTDCYINPGSRAPSICDLGCVDIWKAFVVVNFPSGNFKEGALVTAPLDTIHQMLSVITKCFTNDILLRCVDNLLTTLQIDVFVPIRPTAAYIRTIALKVASYFGEKLSWEQNGFRWFPMVNDNDGNSGIRKINVRVLLVDAKLLNILPLTSGKTLDEAINDLVTAIISGSLSRIPLNIDNIEVISSLSLVSLCMDVGCDPGNTTELVTAPNVIDSPCGAGQVESVFYLVILAMFIAIL